MMLTRLLYPVLFMILIEITLNVLNVVLFNSIMNLLIYRFKNVFLSAPPICSIMLELFNNSIEYLD